MLRRVLDDAKALYRAPGGGRAAVLSMDSFRVLAVQRARESARRWHVPGAGHALRMVQTAVFGIEIGNHVHIGTGVYFIHPIGITIGGDAHIGDRVRFFGNNTVGTAKENGYPTIGDDVVIGAGARILGPIHIGDRAVIGANAVVLDDVPADAVAVGMPARVVRRRQPDEDPAALVYGASA